MASDPALESAAAWAMAPDPAHFKLMAREPAAAVDEYPILERGYLHLDVCNTVMIVQDVSQLPMDV